MDLPPRHLPAEWEERWRTDKARRRRAMEEGDEGVEEADQRELRRIKAYNDSRIMGPVVPQNPSRGEDLPQGGDAEPQEETDAGGGGEKGGPEEGDGGVLQYCRESHPEEVYAALRGLRECSLLTDLTLILGGRGAASLRVHSPVLASAPWSGTP